MNSAYNLILNNKAKEISILESKIKAMLVENETCLQDYFINFLFTSSKKLRPIFLFFLCDFFKIEPDDDIYNLACAIETLHSASLIHDDIVDNAKKRRNAPCIHINKSAKQAVLAGDYLLSLAMRFLSKINNRSLFELMAKTSVQMSKGEIWALNNRNKIPSLDDYINYSKEKTSSLFVFALKGLCLIKNIEAPAELIKFTENFALSFQLRDDINNFIDKDKFKIANDENEGIYTLPFILGAYDIMKSREFVESIVRDAENFLKSLNNGKALFPILSILKKES